MSEPKTPRLILPCVHGYEQRSHWVTRYGGITIWRSDAANPEDEPCEGATVTTNLLAVVRRAVESGTIEGEVVWWCQGTRVTDDGAIEGILPGSLAWQNCFEGRIPRHRNCGWRLVISDGGEG